MGPPLFCATPSGQLVYLATRLGRAHSVKACGNWFAKRCREAGPEAKLPAHGLRKCAARRSTEAGATEHQFLALFGWTSPRQAARYTQNVSRRRLEAAAAPLPVQGQKGNEGVQLPEARGVQPDSWRKKDVINQYPV